MKKKTAFRAAFLSLGLGALLAVSAAAADNAVVTITASKATEDIKKDDVVTYTVAVNPGSTSMGCLQVNFEGTNLEIQNGTAAEVAETSEYVTDSTAGNKGTLVIAGNETAFAADTEFQVATLKAKATADGASFASTTAVTYDADGENGFAPTVTLAVQPGVTVSGTVTSYGSATETVTVTLLDSSNAKVGDAKTLTGNSAEYSFTGVPANAAYTLKVEKKGHAPWTQSVEVGTDNLTGQSATIYLLGDVNGDGVVVQGDCTILKRYFAGWDGYEERIVSRSAADVNKDGTITQADAAILSRYFAGWTGYDEYFK